MKLLEEYDLLFKMKLERWPFLRRRFDEYFGSQAVEKLITERGQFDAARKTVVQLAFENRFASLGGLAPATRNLTRQLESMREQVLFIAPYHSRCMAKTAVKSSVERVGVESHFRCGGYEGVFSLWRDKDAPVSTFYLKVPGRFFAEGSPYNYPDAEDLLLDALVFAAAVPYALQKLGRTDNVLLHGHEWEAALVAVTSRIAAGAGVLRSCRSILTLHNSFDNAIPAELKKLFFGKGLRGDTVLQCAIPFLSGPLVTVSTPFARELSSDPLQKTIFADHLQTVFQMNPPVGIENGVFTDGSPSYTPAMLAGVEEGNFSKVLTRKRSHRRKLLDVLAGRRAGAIGKISIDKTDKNTPLFFMAGRLDMTQKGFDLIFSAFERMERGSAKLLFCPSQASKTFAKDLKFFERIAKKCPGDIEIWPAKIDRKLYDAVLHGATYLLMPSLYEPFGAANEGLAAGTPVIARGTGGLWVQVNPASPVRIPSFYGRLPLDGKRVLPTGILFREQYPDSKAGAEWRELLKVPVSRRHSVPLYAAMVDAAQAALEHAQALFARPDDYGRLIANGVAEVKKFSWDRAAEMYRQVYDVAIRRGI